MTIEIAMELAIRLVQVMGIVRIVSKVFRQVD
jgi:hypothetical protein